MSFIAYMLFFETVFDVSMRKSLTEISQIDEAFMVILEELLPEKSGGYQRVLRL